MLAAVSFLPVPASALSAEKAILMDAVTGRIIYEKAADEQSLIASTTKIMTALIICEQCNVLDRVRIPKEAVGIEGSSMYLREGEILTVQELLYGLMLRSGNDAAVALAIYCSGTVEGFAQQMNDKARTLGMDGSHFVNPNGLDAPDHYATARDLAVLASYAMENPIFRQTVSTKSVAVGQRLLTNHNKLLWRLDGADGVKTGYTKAAGRILVSSATRSGRRLVGVTINAPDDWNDHAVLMEQGFSNYAVRKVIQTGQILGHVVIAGGQSARVQLLAASDFEYPMAVQESYEIKLAGPGFAYAPVAAGAEAGTAHICISGKAIGSVPMIFGETVEQETEKEKGFFEKLFGRD